MGKKIKRDNSNIETLGVSHLSKCIANSRNLHPIFNKDDKILLFDGKIIIYRDIPFSINNYMGEVPVQIKTTTNISKNKKFKNKSIKCNLLKKYLNAGGVVYFYIIIDNNNYYIYFSLLSPIKIQKYLNENENKKNIPITFSEFPIDNITLFTNLLIEFYRETKCAISFNTYSLGDLKELKKAGFDHLKINISTIGYNNLLDRFYDYPIYIHAKNTKMGIEISIDEKYFGVGVQENNPITINGKIFYNHIDIINYKNKKIYNFGKNIILTFEKLDNSIRFNLAFNVSNKLVEKIIDLDFLISLFEYKIFYIGDVEYKFPVSVEEWNRDNSDLSLGFLKESLEYYNDIKDTFNKLNIKKELDFTNFFEPDKINLRFLVNGIKYNRSQIVNNHNEENIIQNLKISNIWVRIIMIKQNDGKYLIENYFNGNLTGFYPKSSNKNEYFFISPYTFMDIEDFVKISNIDYIHIYESFIKLPDDDELFQMTIHLIFNMLFAFDTMKEKDNDLLSCTLKLTEWLLTKNTSFNSLIKINKLQIIKRIRELTDDENVILLEIITTEKDNIVLTGAYILLNNSILAKRHYEKLSLEEKELFNEFPINIYRKFDIIDTINEGEHIINDNQN